MSRKVVRYKAAGGVVLSPDDRVLLIERTVEGKHEIRLPKGHIENDETPEAAALREVCEETGHCDLIVLADLGWHSTKFAYNGVTVEREERYYLMRLASYRQQQPAFSSDREALYHNLWADDLRQAEALLTFESEQAVVHRALAQAAPGGAS